MTQVAIDHLIRDLSHAETAPDAFNEYAGDDPNNTIRRENLRTYFNALAARKPESMLVMEAPGYRGCRLTGVPVTSRKLLVEGVTGLDWFGTANGYVEPHDVGFERIKGEQSATIVWGALSDIGVIPVVWNTFPFHPHKPDRPLTNRAPRKPEVDLGITFLMRVIDLFSPSQVIAVGNVAHRALTASGVPCEKVRHPAQGGKNDFVSGINRLLGKDMS